MRQLLNMKRSSEGGVEKTSIVNTITDKSMICDVPLVDYLQNVHRKLPVLSVYGLSSLKWYEQYDTGNR